MSTDERLDRLIDATEKQIALAQRQMAWMVKRADDEQEQAEKLVSRIEKLAWTITSEMRLAAIIYLLSTLAAVLFGGYTALQLFSHR